LLKENLALLLDHPGLVLGVASTRKDRTSMTAKPQPDIEAVASDFCDLEELVTERLHEIHKTYGLDTLRDVADRLKHSINCDVEIAIERR
jgi:hypothetical protein